MKFFKDLFHSSSKTPKDSGGFQEDNPALEDDFVHHFIKKGGKFLYCEKQEELQLNLQAILKENGWKEISCTDAKLINLIDKVEAVVIKNELEPSLPFFTSCEHLIADNGSILFSSNQLKSNKLAEMSSYFIVCAKTSQFVKNTGEGLTGIKTNFKENIPTNISAIKSYKPDQSDDNFLNYSGNNAKNLYLLLLEDL